MCVSRQGLELGNLGLGGQRLIHWATGAMNTRKFEWLYTKICKNKKVQFLTKKSDFNEI